MEFSNMVLISSAINLMGQRSMEINQEIESLLELDYTDGAVLNLENERDSITNKSCFYSGVLDKFGDMTVGTVKRLSLDDIADLI